MNDTLQALRPYADEFIAIRHDIHSQPELGYEEVRTGELVAQRLRAWGYEVEQGLAVTGVVGRLRRGDGQRRLGLRADMDALSIHETTGLAYASRRHGVMHACGHDGHTAMLLGAARYLAEHGRFSGTLNLIFQPAEEGKGGAARMMAEGLFDKYPCDAVFGMHNLPGYPQGHLMFRPGPTMASADRVEITLHGVGGHGAMPHKAVDPVVAGAAIVMALQTIVSRNVDPLEAAVVTVGAFNGGRTSNVIAASARLDVTVRAFSREVRDLLERRIRELVEAQARSFGVTAEIEYDRRYPVLVNTPAETEFAARTAVELLGAGEVLHPCPAIAGAEDFAYMLESVPGCYLFIGNGDGERGSPCMIHNPGFDFDDGNVAIGAAYWALLAQRFLVDAAD